MILTVSLFALHTWSWQFHYEHCTHDLDSSIMCTAHMILTVSLWALHTWSWQFHYVHCTHDLDSSVMCTAHMILTVSLWALHIWSWQSHYVHCTHDPEVPLSALHTWSWQFHYVHCTHDPDSSIMCTAHMILTVPLCALHTWSFQFHYVHCTLDPESSISRTTQHYRLEPDRSPCLHSSLQLLAVTKEMEKKLADVGKEHLLLDSRKAPGKWDSNRTAARHTIFLNQLSYSYAMKFLRRFTRFLDFNVYSSKTTLLENLISFRPRVRRLDPQWVQYTVTGRKNFLSLTFTFFPQSSVFKPPILASVSFLTPIQHNMKKNIFASF